MITVSSFHFLRPLWLLIIPVCILIYFFLSKKQITDNQPWRTAIASHLLSVLTPSHQNTTTYYGKLLQLLLFVWIIASIALAGPTWRKTEAPLEKNNSALMIVVDLSPKMNTDDLKPDRITRMQRKLTDLFKMREDGITGIVAFAESAYTVAPLTDDVKTLIHLTKALNPKIMPSPGRNTFAGIEKAVQLLRQGGAQRGDIILVSYEVSDLQITKISQLLASTHYKLHTLGIGSKEGAPVRDVNDSLMRGPRGEIIFSHLDANSLLELANANHGFYQTTTIDERDISALLKNIEKNISTEESDIHLNQWYDEGIWLSILLIPFALLAFRRGWLYSAIFIVLLLPVAQNSEASLWQQLWSTPDQQGKKLMLAKDYQSAAQTFKNPAWKAEALNKAGKFEKSAELFSVLNTAAGYYNRGNALAHSGKLSEALEAYDKALQLDNNLNEAKTNRDLVKEFLSKQPQSSSNNQKMAQDDKADTTKEPQPPQQSSNATKESQSSQQNSDSISATDNQVSAQSDNEQTPNKNAENQTNSQSTTEKDSNLKQMSSEKFFSQKQSTNQSSKDADPQLSDQSSAQYTTADSSQNELQDNHQPVKKEIGNDFDQQTKTLNQEQLNRDKLSQQELEYWFRKIQDNPENLLKHKFYIQQQQHQRQTLQEQLQW